MSEYVVVMSGGSSVHFRSYDIREGGEVVGVKDSIPWYYPQPGEWPDVPDDMPNEEKDI